MKVGDSLGCSDDEMVEFRILKRGNKAKGRITTTDFRRAHFGVFRHQLERIPWETALKRREVQDLVAFQESPFPSSKMVHLHMQEIKQKQEELLTKRRHKKEAHVRWNEGQVNWEE